MHVYAYFFRDILLLEVGFLTVLVAPFKLTLLDTSPRYIPEISFSTIYDSHSTLLISESQ